MSPASLLQMLQGYLQVTNDRQQLIASNMANADTPGYQTRDINFHEALKNAMSPVKGMELQPASQAVQGLPERPDGNNVSIDREGMLMSETQLQYQMGIQLIKSEFSKLLIAIKES